MGSKNLKRRKLKCKKIEKVYKLKASKQMKSNTSKINKEKSCERDLTPENYTDNRSKKNNLFLSCDENDILELKNFSKIREDYFIYLQNVISDNCVFYDSIVTEETLQNLALELEQNALLACLQIDIYKKSMCRIIREIKKSTEEKQVHEEVRKLLPDSVKEKNDNIKPEKTSTNIPDVEGYSRIPTIDSIRSNKNSMNDSNFWMEQSDYNSDMYFLTPGQEDESLIAPSWMENKAYSLQLDHSDYWNSEIPHTNPNTLDESHDMQIADDNQWSTIQNNCTDVNKNNNVSPRSSTNNKEKCDNVDPLLVSRSHLQKLVEKTLNETEKIQRQKRDEQERAYIAQILEGDDSLDERINDSLSDNENESKENVDESNLMDRLEKMRELFGAEEKESSKEAVPDKPKPRVNHVNSHSHRPSSWRYEKYIQLHKYFLIAGEMSYERRHMNRKLFLELFGDDSDDEHEKEYSSEEKYRSSCTERISSWVVKYLMPFYHEKRILGRSVFKTLGHHISDTIVDAIQYPDEWTVKYYVSKFFPPKKKYTCDADVMNYQLD